MPMSEQTNKTEAGSFEDGTLDLEKWGKYLVPQKVHGQTTMVPLSQVVAKAQKAEAVERKMEALAAKEEELEVAREIADALKKGWATKSPELVIQAMVTAGVPREVAEPWVKGEQPAHASGGRPNADDEDDDADDDVSSKGEKLTDIIRQMPEFQALQEMSEAYRQNKVRLDRQAKIDEIRQALDSDPELGTLYKKLSGKPKAQRQVLDSVIVAVQGRLPEFPGWGPRPIQAGLADAKASLKELGILTDEQSTSPGLGSSDLPVSGAAHLSDDAAALLRQDDGKKNWSLFDDDAELKMTRRIAEHLTGRT